MSKIDLFSYNLGVIDCFAEMVKAGIKPLALAHPFKSKDARSEYLPYVAKISSDYQIFYYLDDDPLISDLFPVSQNKGTYNIIFYRRKEDIENYQKLKILKDEAIRNGIYDEIREDIAYRFGRLLGYPTQNITSYIQENKEKE